MTVPIIPGPFSFLAEAGQAAGDIGRAKEERKERAQKIAEHGATSVLDQLLAGADPGILDQPDVQKMFQIAGYPHLSSANFKFVGGAAAAAGAGGRAKIEEGVPKAEATAARGAADVSARTSAAQLSAGVPELTADAQAAQAEASKLGAAFNVQVYQAANERFASEKDPEFKRLAVEAATGVLDYRIRRLQLVRENLSLERQFMADRARTYLEAMKMSNADYKDAIDNYERQRRIDLINNKLDPDDPKQQARDEQANPRPTLEDARNAVIKGLGVSPDEYKRVIREGLGLSGSAPAGTVGQAAPTAPTPDGGVTLDETYRRVEQQLFTTTDPDADAKSLFQRVVSGKIDPYTIQLVFIRLRRQLPGSKYTKLRDAYNQAVESSGAYGRAVEIPE